MMNYYARVGLAILLSRASAEYSPIGGYMTGTNVVDHGNIDLDQAAVEDCIGGKNATSYEKGQAIYENGGNSKSVATVTFSAETTSDIAKGTVFSGVGLGGGVVTASAYDTYLAGSTSIVLKYAPTTCLIGALPEPTVTDGCFITDGAITDGTNTLDYTYSLTDNKAKRTLKGFSTAVASKMSGEKHANYFKDYYGVYDYADQIVTAAFQGGVTTMPSNNVDFSDVEFSGTEQNVKKGIAYMNVFMYAIHEFEASVNKCVDGEAYDQENAVHAWDEGVAFFVGNLAGKTGKDDGKLVWALGNKRCKNFGTCGASGTEIKGLAKVNLDLATLWNRGRDELNAGTCDVATATKDAMVDLMYIPLIQGTLKYAYKGETGDAKTKAEGTAFALALLGRVNAASADAASTIYTSMKPGGTFSGVDVKAALEAVYDDMNISCEDVGGLFEDAVLGTYYPGMEPCSTPCTDKGKGGMNKYTELSTGLTMSCGELAAFTPELKAEFCTDGASDVCPVTCAGFCSCTDEPSNEFTTQGKTRTCLKLAKFGTKRLRNFCKLGGGVACPDTCRGFCKVLPFAPEDYVGPVTEPPRPPVALDDD